MSSPTRLTEFVRGAKIEDGLLTCFIRHTSASLLIQENADPDVQKDLQDFFARLATSGMRFPPHRRRAGRHALAYPRGADPDLDWRFRCTSGRLALGTWQGIYVFEHRDAPHRREVMLHYIGRLETARPSPPVPSARFPAARHNAKSLPPPPARPAGRNRPGPCHGSGHRGIRRRTGRPRRWCRSPVSTGAAGTVMHLAFLDDHAALGRAGQGGDAAPCLRAARSRRRNLLPGTAPWLRLHWRTGCSHPCPADAGIRRGSGRRRKESDSDSATRPPAPLTAAIALREACLALSSSHR